MGLREYESSQILSRNAYDLPGNAFYSLLMATIREAGSDELELLEQAFPGTVSELRQRYNAPMGVLDTDIRNTLCTKPMQWPHE